MTNREEDELDDEQQRPVVKPLEDRPDQPPVPAGEPSRTEEEAGRQDLAIRGAVAGGALGGAAGYTGGAATGVGGAVGMRQLQAEEAEEADDDAEPPENMAQADV